MPADHLIAARVSADTKARLRALATQQGVTESVILKRLVDKALEAGGPSLAAVVAAPETARAARLYVRLHPDDRQLLAERARAPQMAAATYVSVLVRAHLRQLMPLPKDELLAFKLAVSQLGLAGRSLSILARAAQSGQQVSAPGQREVQLMLQMCEALRSHFKATLSANLRSWRVGHENSNRP